MNEVRKDQFRMIAQILVDIEAATLQLYEQTGHGFSIKLVDTYLQQEKVNVHGAAVLVAMIRASDLVQFSEDESMLIPREVKEAVTVVEMEP